MVEGLCRWDCLWYLSIVENGYDLEPRGEDLNNAVNWVFFPLMPMAVWLLTALSGLNAVFTGFILANIFHYFGIWFSLQYLRLTRLQVAEKIWVWLCALGPLSFYFSTTLSEPLFFFLGCSAMLLWERRNYVSAGFCMALLSATREFGIFWLVCFAAQLILHPDSTYKRETFKNPKVFLSFCLAPLDFLFSHCSCISTPVMPLIHSRPEIVGRGGHRCD